MSLGKWVEYGWLRPEATSLDEIQGLLSIVDRGLHDSKVEEISIAFASLQHSIPPLRLQLSHFGPLVFVYPVRPGIMSRPLNLSNSPIRKVERLFKVMSNKRNRSSYDAAG